MNNKTLALDFFKAADRGDFAAVEKFFGPRHQFHSSMSPVPLDTIGHLGIMQAFHGAFADTSHEIHDLLETGNKVIVRGTWHGTQTGPFNNIPSQGKSVKLPFISIVEVENGEMVNQWIELDSMSMMMQMGAMPAPAAAGM